MSIHWRRSIGHNRVKETISQAFDRDKLGHAYLFAGATGVGKFPLALEFAMALLCEADQKPCYQCTACRKVLSHSHPDFRYLFPINFAADHKVKSSPGKLSEKGWEFIAEKLHEKLQHPYNENSSYSAATPVDWIREVNHTIHRGSNEGGYTVIIIEGIENFRAEAANAMLKTLEEPPAKTVMILLTRSIHQVLPTIRSRCQVHRFGLVDNETMRVSLAKDFSTKSTEEIRLAVSAAEGSMGKGILLLSAGIEDKIAFGKPFLQLLFASENRLEQALAVEHFVEEQIGGDYETAEGIIHFFLDELRTTFLKAYEGGGEYIFPDSAALFPKLSLSQVQKIIACCEESVLSVKRHSPMLMIFSNLMLRIVEIIDEK